jgi:putative transposase
MGDTTTLGADPRREVAMPWLETLPMDQRTRFLADHGRGLYDMTELCARYGASRKTGYKWLARYAADGARGLADRSHAPHRCPHRIDAALAELLLAARRAHPRGARRSSCSTSRRATRA